MRARHESKPFPTIFRTQILLSALGVQFIYTHVYIFSYVSPFIEEQIRTRSNVSLESADSVFQICILISGERLKGKVTIL